MNKDLPIGTKVFLSPESRWVGRGEYNPIGVAGEVVTQGTIWVVVRWGENLTNSYVGDENDLLRSNPLADVGNLKEFLMDIVTECGTLSREGTTAKGIVKRLLNSGLIKENK